MDSTVKISLLLMILLTSACADLSYYLHSVEGQFSVMSKTRDIDDLLEDDSTRNELREKLKLVESIRQFAFQQLQLPESDSYTQYADVGRAYVLKNLFATAEFSTRLQHWCYPIAGCAGYRGYFDEDLLKKFKSKLELEGKDVYVANIPAYSTLGWFDDPVLNTFINWPDYRLAGLIFHELAHQRLYIDNDSQFNESFAMAVQQTAVEKWLLEKGQFSRADRYREYLINRQLVIQLIEETRNQLSKLYKEELNQGEKRQLKQKILSRLKQDYVQLSSSFEVADGFKYWFQGTLNNAKLASVSTYHSSVPAFRNILKNTHGDYKLFYTEVERIARLPEKKRHYCLAYWMSSVEKHGSC